MAVNYNNQNNRPCKWHDLETCRNVFLGPNEGPVHAEVVRSARQRGFQSSPPDLYIAVGGQMEKIHRTQLMLESPDLQKFYTKHADWHTIRLKDPVDPCHLSKIANYLYAKDYAVFPTDIFAIPTGFKGRETNCRRCDEFLRLLNFHFSLFQAARYMHIEGLELLAIKKLNGVLEVSPLAVLRRAIDLVYGYKPFVHPGRNDVYGIAHFIDYREHFVLPAVMYFMRREWAELESANPLSFLRKDLPGFVDPIRSFEDLIRMYPDFGHHVTLWSVVGQYLPFMGLCNLK
ncbi:hypothetical protein N7478_007481 [Penicillium angulare]|uniref:uncharacterized protein n=1 Tax=Penicillium angulare TaxID=116970 RepID=UPI00253FE2E5|nr:uncharacterized protein N7478_007481 [Penicillium angulare]KAJ5272356.1 hypothetical protein N7478_007481 [Penicillium angulare]